MDVPRGSGVKFDPKQGSESSSPSIEVSAWFLPTENRLSLPRMRSQEVIKQEDLPIPKLSVQTVSETSIRSNWYLDRPLPPNAFVAFYEVHVRGPEFADKMTSDER